ncbi:amidase signature domain-containing protein [Xylaria castorea]|nr:amidase signature domain-containing protein [Xylaria castorea]
MAPQLSPSTSTKDWQSRVAEKRSICQKAIPKAWILTQSLLDTLSAQSELSKTKTNLISLNIPRHSGILTERELEITESYNVSSLLEGLATGRFTSAEVTLAFSKRAAIAQQLTNCLTETFFEEAQQRARFLDDSRAQGKLAGPLHGLPVSLKDTYQVKGTQATIGAVSYLDTTSSENSALVNMLLDLGAVPYVKTNVSQLLVGVESDNNIFGRVLNPWNTMLTAGGSSGGEGALIAFRGSVLGVGTDLAGSIRIPSLCCGTYGFKPSTNRIAYEGQVMPFKEGILPIVPSAGPLANDVETLQIFMKAVIDAKPARYDATAIDVPWRSTNILPRQSLRLGLLLEDPLFPLHPPVKEAIAKAAKVLRSYGHEVVLLDAAECHVAEANQIAGGLLSLDTTPREIIAAGGEPALPSMSMLAEQAKSIEWNFVPDLGAMDDLQKLGLLQSQRARLAEDWRKLWVKHRLDAVISPSAQNTAVEHDTFCWPAYSAFLNLLDYPACVIPFQQAAKSELPFVVRPGQGTPLYNPKAVEGAPCSIQIFTSRMRDEECLAVASIVDECLKDSKN